MTWIVKGTPFSSHQSSCSNLKPRMFSWDDDIDLDVELWVDYALEEGIHAPREKKYKYAWICESRSILPFLSRLYETDEHGHKVVRGITPTLQSMIDSYDAIFTCDKELVALHDKIHFSFAGSTLPWTVTDDLYTLDKSKSCSFVASNKLMCVGHAYRKYVYDYIISNGLSSIDSYGSITGEDYFGKCDRCWERGGGDGWMDKSSALVDYKFSIVMENDFYSTYYTEKLTDCFSTATVPIYLGCPDIADHFNIDGIIQAENPDHLNQIISHFHQNNSWDVEYARRIMAVRDNYNRIGFIRHPDDMLYAKIMEMTK